MILISINWNILYRYMPKYTIRRITLRMGLKDEIFSRGAKPISVLSAELCVLPNSTMVSVVNRIKAYMACMYDTSTWGILDKRRLRNLNQNHRTFLNNSAQAKFLGGGACNMLLFLQLNEPLDVCDSCQITKLCRCAGYMLYTPGLL